jgi:hypothetical protein
MLARFSCKKRKLMNTPHIMVIYDGIENSVFEGQVAQPLIKYRAQHPTQPILLISFERHPNKALFTKTEAMLKTYAITLIILKKYPLITHVPLLLATRPLQKILSKLGNYQVIARGSLAGYICLRAHNPARCATLTIQARGLLAEEYALSTRDTKGLVVWYHSYKLRLFKNIETFVYTSATDNTIQIQAVSSALKDYLIATYGTPASRITIANHDIPLPIPQAQKQEWRAATRSALAIADTTHVYCYNGSAKVWQCPQETVAYFAQQYAQNPDSLLLILTQDTAVFKPIVEEHRLPAHSYRIMHVEHAQIYTYLAACDTGIIMREINAINWTSRPTKILEYQAVGLAIAHNNSIGYLQEQK